MNVISNNCSRTLSTDFTVEIFHSNEKFFSIKWCYILIQDLKLCPHIKLSFEADPPWKGFLPDKHGVPVLYCTGKKKIEQHCLSSKLPKKTLQETCEMDHYSNIEHGNKNMYPSGYESSLFWQRPTSLTFPSLESLAFSSTSKASTKSKNWKLNLRPQSQLQIFQLKPTLT